MRFFYREIIITLLMTLVIGEILCRLLPIVPDIPERINKKGYYMLKENQKGKYIRGKFPKWLEASYSINNLGFVSAVDYYLDEENENKIAIVGDSFVESFQVNESQSIGRLIEKANPALKVYEFGFSGYNFYDFINIYKEYNLDTFGYVFIILDKTDVLANESSKIIFTETLKLKEKFFRGIYDNFYFFKYLNWNHAFIRELIKLPSKINPRNFQSNKFTKNLKPAPISPFVEGKNIFLVLKSDKDTILRSYYPDLDFISINQKLKPFNFGFDKHWNLNGRKNVAETLIQWIKNQKK